MSNKLLSLIQSVIIIFFGVVSLDFALYWYNEDFGFYVTLFEDPDTWWNYTILRAYVILVVGVLQLLKALATED